ncbi:MAG: hypothetical protein M3Q48_08040 [Actinomycetota bacterium]|nr:hypothetical protein [Actinomycetota bacterium]
MNKIRQAIDVLAARGWTKGVFTDLSGRHCLQGALYEAHGVCPLRRGSVVGPLPSELAADVRLVNEVVEANYPERFGGVGVSRFNDHPETTVDDVVLVLEKAAVRRDELL